MKRENIWALAVVYSLPVAIAVTVAAIAGCSSPAMQGMVNALQQPLFVVQPPTVSVQAPAVAVQTPGVAVQEQPAGTPAPDQQAAPEADPQVVQLVAPVALYPDPLLADTLPATTYSQEVQEAGQFLQTNPQPTDDQINGQAWDPAVKAIVHYPTVVQTLTADPQWTENLGSAYTANQQGVMVAVQDLRQQAVTAGNLKDSPQTTVVQQDNVIAVQPANPQVVVVPTYDPVVVYTQPAVITYGLAYPTGVWLVDGIAWNSDVVFVGDWHGGYVYGPNGWYHDRFYRYDRFTRSWAHNDRFGRAPHVPSSRWGSPRSFGGRALPAKVVSHATQRIRTASAEHARAAGTAGRTAGTAGRPTGATGRPTGAAGRPGMTPNAAHPNVARPGGAAPAAHAPAAAPKKK